MSLLEFSLDWIWLSIVMALTFGPALKKALVVDAPEGE